MTTTLTCFLNKYSLNQTPLAAKHKKLRRCSVNN